jgi:hypothetical protein
MYFTMDHLPPSKEPCDSPESIGSHANAWKITLNLLPDNGKSWHDHAVSDRIANPYAIGGAREVAGDGSVIGSFTDQVGPEGSPGGAKVYFFRIPGRS